MEVQQKKIAIVGLGYVGLPLAVEFSKYFQVVGFDIDENRIKALHNRNDYTKEVAESDLRGAKELSFTNNIEDIKDCNFYIVSVPTPITKDNLPNLDPLFHACEWIGALLKQGDIVVFESTVFPGCTEELCVPKLEQASNLTFNKDFFCGYSPERINPGDYNKKLKDITKLVSGSTPETLDVIDQLYSKIIKAGTYRVKDIKSAEAAKVIENTQRDLNIALVNELSKIFDLMNINTKEVIRAAATKWNFIPFEPGLVGGHCIGVDPYYLTYKAKSLGYNPEIILAGRRMNESMPNFVAVKLIKKMIKNEIKINKAKVLLMGLTFKENCSDIRNSKAFELIKELKAFGLVVETYDNWVDPNFVKNLSNKHRINLENKPLYEAIVVAVPHKQFQQMGVANIKKNLKRNGVLFDVKSVFLTSETDLRL